MRVLFSTTAGSGHFGPMVPVARACVAAGHEVAVAAPGSFAPAVSRAGFVHRPFADVPPEVLGAVFAGLGELPQEAANRTVIVEVFGRLDAQAALPALTTTIADWRPDIVVRDPSEFASLVAAERAGVPQVQVAIGMSNVWRDVATMLEEPLAELSELAGLPAVRGRELLVTSAVLTSVPARLDGEDDGADHRRVSQPTGPVWRFRDGSSSGSSRLPSSWGHPEDPLVYISFGSITAGMGRFAALYELALRALADVSLRVFITTGDGLDPGTLSPPANARVERWWPQADVMPTAAAMVGHGGFGTTMTALAAGVPQVVMPLFAFDQFVNAERVAAVGAGLQLTGAADAVGKLPAALSRLLHDPAFGAGARAVATDIAALPDVADCVAVLEGLVGRTG